MVDMANDRHDRGAGLERRLVVYLFIVAYVDIGFADALDLVPEFGDEQFGGVLVDRLVDGHRHTHLEQRLDQVGALFGHAVRQFLHRDAVGHDDFADLLFARSRRGGMRALFLFAGALERGEAARAGALILVERADRTRVGEGKRVYVRGVL